MNEPISSTEVERDLGILLRADLKSSSHATLIVQRAERCLAVLKRNIVNRDRKVFLKLYKQLVRPHLEYVACLWNPSLKEDIELIERVQHRATKCITGLQSKSYTDRLKILGLVSLQTRRFIFDMVEVFRIFQNDTSDRRLFELSKSGHNTGGVITLGLKRSTVSQNAEKTFFQTA